MAVKWAGSTMPCQLPITMEMPKDSSVEARSSASVPNRACRPSTRTEREARAIRLIAPSWEAATSVDSTAETATTPTSRGRLAVTSAAAQEHAPVIQSASTSPMKPMSSAAAAGPMMFTMALSD
ncbi:Uncharacterised protein [Collinsella intestinalis]|nr:Uncharacterised protein [Collinsella intestinalis]